ncbi:hypothetical protein GMRT_14139 [Giardia muris]|uniref:Uncharacterized protein n=1 Tax=Giardia muris TaxID=5742 RepID=A0A4Z1T730_GIAMU|nr:hypothetical protein GMRT_14139 [Giardia muris]|eukprot:TNJ28349.1 hypothetical protein GMRT_14139 [Giardia muris]
MSGSFEIPINAVARACRIDEQGCRLSKDARGALAQACVTSISFVSFLASNRLGSSQLTQRAVLSVLGTMGIDGLQEAAGRFISEAAITSPDPFDVLLRDDVQRAAISRWDDVPFPPVSLELFEEKD